MELNFFFIIMLVFAVNSTREECNDITPCPIKDSINITDVFELLNEETNETTTTENNTEGSSTILIEVEEAKTTLAPTQLPTSTTVATTTTTPTLPSTIPDGQPNTICWCDILLGECDINCCCDKECSKAQKHVFTHCSDLKLLHNHDRCYSTNFLFRKPSFVQTTENNGLFCIVRDNISTKREFKNRSPITKIDEFEKIMHNRRILRHINHFNIMPDFVPRSYKGGDVLWVLQNEQLLPFSILSATFGDLCLSSTPVRYLEDLSTTCLLRLPRQEPSCSQAINDLLKKLTDMRIITSPLHVNMSDIKNSIENCSSYGACVPIHLHICKSFTTQCMRVGSTENLAPTPNCQKFGLEVSIEIMHNGTDGVQSANASIRILNQKKLKIQVKFFWSDSNGTGFQRSGNPGYIYKMPVLSGRKVILVSNDTTLTTKEAIEMTIHPKGWLTVLDNEKGHCSSKNRRPVLFNQNIKQSCFMELDKKYFTKNGCIEMQRIIFQLLLGESATNLESAPINKFLGIFGNSRVEVMADWVQVMVENFPLISNQPTYENSSGPSCKGLFTQLFIDIAVSKFGSYENPQMKILGSLFRFGSPREFNVRCAESCELMPSKLILKTEVFFMDLTRPSVREFAHPPGLEAKLPHDFFYPFFSGKASYSQIYNQLYIVCVIFFVL